MVYRYILASSRLALDLPAGSGSLRVIAGDGRNFTLPVGQYTFIKLTDGRHVEVVRYNGTPIFTDTIPVTRAQNGTQARVWSKGTCVEVVFTEASLKQLIQDECFAAVTDDDCGLGCALTNQVLNSNNTFSGVQSFLNTVTIGSAAIQPANSVDPRLSVNAGWDVTLNASGPFDATGYRATVTRVNGSGRTSGGVFEASAQLGVNTPVDGVVGFVESQQGSAAPLLAGEFQVRNKDSSNSSAKVALRSVYSNREELSDVVPIASNRYNTATIAHEIVAQAPSSAGENSGFERGVVFREGSIGRSLLQRAIGIDFAELSSIDVAEIEAGIRLRANLAVELNGDINPYSSKKLLFSDGNNQVQLRDFANARFGVDMSSAIIHLSDAGGTPGSLTSPTAGAASGLHLNIFINGTAYKLALLNA